MNAIMVERQRRGLALAGFSVKGAPQKRRLLFSSLIGESAAPVRTMILQEHREKIVKNEFLLPRSLPEKNPFRDFNDILEHLF